VGAQEKVYSPAMRVVTAMEHPGDGEIAIRDLIYIGIHPGLLTSFSRFFTGQTGQPRLLAGEGPGLQSAGAANKDPGWRRRLASSSLAPGGTQKQPLFPVYY